MPLLYLSYTQNDIPYGDALTTSLTGIFNHYYVELKLWSWCWWGRFRLSFRLTNALNQWCCVMKHSRIWLAVENVSGLNWKVYALCPKLVGTLTFNNIIWNFKCGRLIINLKVKMYNDTVLIRSFDIKLDEIWNIVSCQFSPNRNQLSSGCCGYLSRHTECQDWVPKMGMAKIQLHGMFGFPIWLWCRGVNKALTRSCQFCFSLGKI